MDDNRKFILESSSMKEKLNIIADEVLNILKDLSKDSSKKLSSQSITECLFLKDSVKKLIQSPEADHSDKEKSTNVGKKGEITLLRNITETIMDRFSELSPAFLGSQFAYLNDQYLDKSTLDETGKWLNSSFKIVKKYFDSITSRNDELEQFIVETMQCLHETEEHFLSEMKTFQQACNENKGFSEKLSTNIEKISNDFEEVSDLKALKKAVMGTIGNINKCVDEKNKIDMHQMKEKENKLKLLGSRINDIKKEDDVIKKKAEKLEQQSLLDELTGVNNLKAYEKRMSELLADLKRNKILASLILCDIDRFKIINDTYGHKVGDLALKKFASLLNEKINAKDFVARYGGELFAVILPNISLEDAKVVGEKVRGFIYNSNFSYKGNQIQLTVSVGVSTLRKDDTASSVFERADRALYLAKHSGRNVVKTEEEVRQESNSYIMTARK
jgi:diguanylate cyclase